VLFTDARFAAIVVAAWMTFVAVPRGWRAGALAFWGVVFYALYAPNAAPVMAALIVVVYLLSARHWVAAVGIAAGVLAAYKLVAGPEALIASGSSTRSVLIPLGLSFLTFELIHYCIERRRGVIAHAAFLDYLAFALYFPCRVAGPIKRYPDFTSAVASAEPSLATVYAGLLRVLVGVVKKVVLADTLGLTVAELATAGDVTPAHALRILLAYSFQIALDFSAYSDIAIGISQMFGIALPENFRRPYLSESIQEFWTRWHISLSSWVRDYVFLPFGRAAFATRLRAHPLTIAVLAYLLAFVIVGAWHGLSPNFVLWGVYHGVLLALHQAYRRTVAARLAAYPFFSSSVARAVSVVATFAFVTVGWVFFITATPAAAARLLGRLVSVG
jgi:alginate O-acetyltransferase complex protein AlgI